jgi:putative ABC transport system permease protein
VHSLNLFNLCWKEIRHHPRFVLIFILNSSLGLLGLLAVENFRTTFNSVLEGRSKQLLGADLSISARQGIPKSEGEKLLAFLPDDAIVVKSMQLFSMAAFEGNSRLVSVRSLTYPFPFYGGMIFEDGATYPDSPDVRLAPDEVWIDPELRLMLAVEEGNELRIGNTSFRVARIIREDTLQAFSEGAMAPRVFLSAEGLEKAKLIGVGSTFSERWAVKLPSVSSRESEQLAQQMNQSLIDPAVSVRAPKDRSEQVGRTLNYLNDFLALVSLVALFLSSVGLFYLFRSYLHQRREDMAILSTLGLKKASRFRLYFYHLLVLGAASAVLTSLLGLLLFPILSWALSLILPFPLPPFVGLRPFFLVFMVALVGNALLAIPLLSPVLSLRALEVFQSLETQVKKNSWKEALLYLPWLVFYWLLSVFVSHSLIVGSSFVAVFLIITIIIFPLGHLLLSTLETRGGSLPFKFRLILRTFTQFKLGTLSLFLSLLFGTLLLTMVPTIEHNLRKEVEGPESSRLPSLFLFDIQEEQVESLERIAKKEGVELRGLSAMIQGRLVSINEVPFIRESDRPRTREEEQEFRIRNRGVNLTFRAELDESETLTRGRNFQGPYVWGQAGPAEVTIEQRYARRLGIGLGDKLEFEILDMPFKALVVGIREVRWTSFMPNFFIVFQPGVLDDAPKTYLSVVPSLSFEEKMQFQRVLIDELRNLSIIDISELIARVVSILEQMGVAMQLMAWLSIFVGLFVMYSLVQHQMHLRTRDIVLLKVLGLSFKDLRAMIRYEFFFLSFAASLTGSFLSVFVTMIFAHLFFDGLWSFTLIPLILAVGVITLLGVLISELAARRTLLRRAQELLQESV